MKVEEESPTTSKPSNFRPRSKLPIRRATVDTINTDDIGLDIDADDIGLAIDISDTYSDGSHIWVHTVNVDMELGNLQLPIRQTQLWIGLVPPIKSIIGNEKILTGVMFWL